MNFKNIAIKTMAAVMAFGFISLAGSTVAKAASNITFNGVEEIADVKDGYTHWAVVKEVDENKKSLTATDGKHYKAEEVFSVEGKKIDLSFLNKNKDNIIAVGKGDTFAGSEAWEIKAIPKQSKGFHAAYVGAKTDNKVMLKDKEITADNYINGNDYGFLVAINGTDEYNLKEAKKVQIKLGNGDWQMLNVFFGLGTDANIDDASNKADKTMATLLQSGSTVYLRIPGSTDAWPSKEVKVKFDKLKKAPKLTVDTAKGVVNFKKGQEYKLQKGAAAAGAWTSVDGKKTFAELTINSSDDFIIFVRDAAKGKKAASKEAKVTLKKQDKVTLAAITTTGDLITDELKFELKFPYDIKKGGAFINKKDTEYEYFLVDSADTDTVPPADAKWHKIKAGKKDKKKPDKVKPSKTSVKFAADLSKGNAYGEKNENLKLFVRKAGTKQSKLDGSAFLPGITSKTEGMVAFKIADDLGTITAASPSNVQGSLKAKKDLTTKIDTSISKLFSKKGVTPKIVITEKLSGVTVKASKITKQGVAAPITVKASKNAFKTAGTYTLKFKVIIERAEKEVTVTYTITE